MIPHRPAFGFRFICVKEQKCFRKNSGGRAEGGMFLSSHSGSQIKWGLEVKAVNSSTCYFKWDLNFYCNDMNNIKTT